MKRLLADHTPLPPVTEEQVEIARKKQLKHVKSMMVILSMLTFLVVAVFTGMAGAFGKKSIDSRGYSYDDYWWSYGYRDDETYYKTLAIALGVVGGIWLLCGLCAIFSQNDRRKWLKDPETPGFLVCYCPRHNDEDVVKHMTERYNAGLQLQNANGQTGQFLAPPKYQPDNLTANSPVTQPEKAFTYDTNEPKQHEYQSMKMPEP